jgi:hypothetical protein
VNDLARNSVAVTAIQGSGPVVAAAGEQPDGVAVAAHLQPIAIVP